MKYYLLGVVCLMVTCSCQETIPVQEYYGIVPEPVYMEVKSGTFNLTSKTNMCLLSEKDDLSSSIRFFDELIEKTFGKKTKVVVSSSARKNAINLSINSALQEEGYRIEITSNQINIQSGTPKGVYYAFRSLRQLLPPAVLQGEKTDIIELPQLIIEDEPSFGYRGACWMWGAPFIL